jgi:hypothetical protein
VNDPAPSPSPDQVVDFALATLHERAPALVITRNELALQIACDGGRSLVWNLHDVARLAPTNPGWRDQVRDLGDQVIARATAADEDAPKLGGVGLRLRPDARVPAELRTGEYAAEPVLDGIWAMYGERQADGIAIRPWDMLLADDLSRDKLRTLAAATTLGAEFTYRDMMSPMGEGIPVFTNEEFHPCVAAALLMPAAWWRQLMMGIKPQPNTLLAMVPAPSRIYLTPVDVPEMIQALRSLIPRYQETEEEVLSMHVYRFDGTQWRAVPNA